MTTQSNYREDPALHKTVFANVHSAEDSEQKDFQIFLLPDGMVVQTKPGEVITLDLDQAIELADFFFRTNVMKRVMDMARRQHARRQRRAKRDQPAA